MSSRCRTDALYSYRVCNALTTFWKNRVQCDVKELNRLKQRVSFLQGRLSMLDVFKEVIIQYFAL